MTASAEHLVIGSGAGGALTAAMLAEAGRDVLVLEEGPHVPVGAVEPFSLSHMDRQYRNGGLTAALGRPAIAYVEGCCAGGGTEVNAGLYHPPGEETLARWRAASGVEDLTPEALAPFVAQVERALSIQPLPEGHPAPRASTLLAEGAEALGWPAREIPRWYRYDGPAPVRQSMTETYLPRALAAGARLEVETRVRRVVSRRGRAAGAVTDRGLITAEHVWVCAGAIGSAALLQRSGLGAGVGSTLSMHPTIKAVAEFDEAIDAGGDIPVHQVKPPGGRLSIGGAVSRPGFVALGLADDWGANHALAEHPERLGSYYAALRPDGRGRVRTLPGLRDPLVTFALTRDDVARLGQGLVALTRLLFAAGARTVRPGIHKGGVVRRGDDVEALAARVTRSSPSLLTLHLFSTVPLGGPVDGYGVLRALSGLRVNDASLLPGPPGVNPQGSVMALAARNVHHFLDSD